MAHDQTEPEREDDAIRLGLIRVSPEVEFCQQVFLATNLNLRLNQASAVNPVSDQDVGDV